MESDSVHPLVAEAGAEVARVASAHGAAAAAAARGHGLSPAELRFTPSAGATRGLKIAAGLGAAALFASMVLGPAHQQRAWANLLLASFGLLGFALAGLFFVAVTYLSGATWSVVLRRVPEALARLVPVGGAALLAVLVLKPSLYPWAYPSPDLAEVMHGFKGVWLSRPFFLARSAVYLILWSVFALALVRNSRRQDEDHNFSHTTRNIRLSAGFTVVFAATFWLASFDWIMSLEPRWYSTIFGIYNFAGIFSSGLAVIVVLVAWLSARGPLRGFIQEAHLHDLGKLLFAFSCFWMYIWFSQYMLIWYANIAEETSYFVTRMQGAWKPLFILNMLLNWGIPFGVLLHRGAKRSAKVLTIVALIILAGRWLDLYLMILPPFSFRQAVFGLPEAGAILLLAGGLGLAVVRALQAAPVLPLGDPRLEESLHPAD